MQPSPQTQERPARRVDQACQPCRQLKARCKPSGVPGQCQRCRDFNRACIWPQARTQRRTRRSAARGSAEEGHRGHQSHGNNTAHDSRHQRAAGEADFQTPISQNLGSAGPRNSPPTSLDQLEHIHNFGEQIESTETVREPAGSTASDKDVFHELVTDEQLEALFNDYRPMSAAFPFVPIESETTALTIRRTKPMLLLAIAAAASWKDRKLQTALDQRYREELASHTIVKPQKSVGLVQSLLVYLAWYHYHFSHKSQNIFPLVQLLVGLAVDVGLYQTNNYKRAKNPAGFPAEQRRERDRTLLGCYFMSSAVAGALRKPNLFKKTSIMEDCILRLQNPAETGGDMAIKSLIDQSDLDNRVNELCQALSNRSPMPPDCDSIHLRAELAQFRVSLSMNPSHEAVRTCDFFHHFAQMELSNSSLQELGDNNAVIAECLDAGKAFLDILLDHSVNTYHLIPFPVWMRLPVAIITLSTLALASNSTPSSSTPSIPDQIRLDLYLEALCNRMQTLTTYSATCQPIPDFWKAMYIIMDKARLWYVERIRRSVLTYSATSGEFEQPDINSTEWDDLGGASMWDDFMIQDVWGGFDSHDPTIVM